MTRDPKIISQSPLNPGRKGNETYIIFAHDEKAMRDLKSLGDRATYEKPTRYAKGVVHLLVNGVVGIEDGRLTGLRAGRALKGRGRR